jgi:DNA-binding transcriptional regulator YhcF (GntR family)
MDNFQYNKAIAASEILTTTEAILAYSIANYYNWDTKSPAYPSEDTLAKDCKMSSRTVRRALLGLVNKGYMSYTRQYNKPNLYTPVLPMRTLCPINEDTSGLLKDNIKDNLKDNKDKDSKESFDKNLIEINQVDISLDSIWKVFENEERNSLARPAGTSNRNFNKSNKRVGRSNITNAEKSRFTQELDYSRTLEW